MRGRIAATLGLCAVVAFAAGFADFVAAARRPADPALTADGIVALTGGADRVETALRLLDAGRGGVLLVSGVASGAGLPGLVRRVGLDPAPLAARITLGHAATTTLGNAEETAAWAQARGLRSLLVVTADYHMPRAMLELRRTMPDVALYPQPVPRQAVWEPGAWRLLAVEYVKLLGAWAGLSSRTPVGNSVSG